MSVPTNKTLYNKVKKEADKIYDKPSAYKSGWIVKEYKKRGGEYRGRKKENEGLDRWYKEDWKDIGGKEYPVYRPTKRITKDTPLTESEISPTQLKKQIKKKQKIKGDANLPAFQKKGGNKISTSTIMGDIDFDKMNWGSFKKQFQASKKKLGVKSLEAFANHILDNPKGFRDTTKKRANFYKNVILKKGGSKPNEEKLLDEFLDSFQDEITPATPTEAAEAERQRQNAELIDNMPTHPTLAPRRWVYPNLTAPHLEERRIMNYPLISPLNVDTRDDLTVEARNVRKRYREEVAEDQKREDDRRPIQQVLRKKGGMMTVSDDETDPDLDLLPRNTAEQVLDVLQGNPRNPATHDALMALLPRHGEREDRERLEDSLRAYGHDDGTIRNVIRRYDELYNNFHTPVGSESESESDMDGGNQPDFDAVARQVAQVLPGNDPRERIRAFARDTPIILSSADEYMLDGVADALTDELMRDQQQGGRHIVSHTVRPFFAMN